MQKENKIKNAVNWFEIYTSDFKRAKKFYTEVFKCRLKDIPVNSERHSQMEYTVFPDAGNNNRAVSHLALPLTYRDYLDTALLLKSNKPTIRNKRAYTKEVQATGVSCDFNLVDTGKAGKLYGK